jgi:protein-disulfide isomerase
MSRETKVLLGIVAAVVVLMVGIFAIANKPSSPSSTSSSGQLLRDSSHKTGDGKVTVIEFGDYQCPACGQAYPDTKRIISEYQGKITFVFRNFPLPQHPNAKPSAEAAEAAAAQGKFWEMHDKLYENQNQWVDLPDPTDTFADYAGELGLDANKIKDAIKNNQYANVIGQDQSDGNGLNIQGTPTFFVNGKQVNGIDYKTLKTAIDQAIGQ